MGEHEHGLQWRQKSDHAGTRWAQEKFKFDFMSPLKSLQVLRQDSNIIQFTFSDALTDCHIKVYWPRDKTEHRQTKPSPRGFGCCILWTEETTQAVVCLATHTKCIPLYFREPVQSLLYFLGLDHWCSIGAGRDSKFWLLNNVLCLVTYGFDLSEWESWSVYLTSLLPSLWHSRCKLCSDEFFPFNFTISLF